MKMPIISPGTLVFARGVHTDFKGLKWFVLSGGNDKKCGRKLCIAFDRHGNCFIEQYSWFSPNYILVEPK
jgi:hypothetical protein